MYAWLVLYVGGKPCEHTCIVYVSGANTRFARPAAAMQAALAVCAADLTVDSVFFGCQIVSTITIVATIAAIS